ncbi:hypothetical protein PGT21_005411 [Puccinia graminis f. sp. tritici]|uniref:Uncharacterized protein n=1 Tax=Puccinia graminis f. sp. tritici TaxID=56615 RepID=A0A5B0NGD4_PUCGR|nr:hypothetical protein PGTUg99_024372 [Puccinia graminis f. sp. tritici]KAA1105388.1 hypothetical protein PGT21_005411 [Puccinia graminis f. sp. tritici]
MARQTSQMFLALPIGKIDSAGKSLIPKFDSSKPKYQALAGAGASDGYCTVLDCKLG